MSLFANRAVAMASTIMMLSIGFACFSLPAGAEVAKHFQHVSLNAHDEKSFSYALIRGQGGSIFVGSSDQLKQAKAHGKGSYLWVQKAGQRYLIDDPEIIKSVEALWQPLSTPEQEMNELEKQMEEFTSVMEIHQAEFEAITEVEGLPDPEMMREFEAEMERFSEKIEPIGEQMEAVGEKIEKLADQANEKTRQAIDAAIKDGKAKRLAD